jgi:hypothetical protein
MLRCNSPSEFSEARRELFSQFEAASVGLDRRMWMALTIGELLAAGGLSTRKRARIEALAATHHGRSRSQALAQSFDQGWPTEAIGESLP